MLETLFTSTSELHNFGHVEYEGAMFVLPFIDEELTRKLVQVLNKRAQHPGLLILVDDDQRIGFMKVANYVCSHTSSRYFGYLAQDAFPSDGWLRSAVSMLDQSQASLLAFNDGRTHGTLAAFGLARRSWLKTLYHKYLFFPGYHSNFGDTELTSIAIHQNQFIFNPSCMMIEVDYNINKTWPYPEDETLYKLRESQGFGGII